GWGGPPGAPGSPSGCGNEASTSDNRRTRPRGAGTLGGMTHSPTTDSRAVLTAMYTAEERYLAAGGPGTASFDLLAPCFAPDVVLHQAAALPYGGVWRGHRGMERFFLAMSDIWATFE